MKFLGRALELKDYLIISDLHAGIESLLNEKGFLFPKILNSEMLKELKLLREVSNANTLVINGDVKHEFSKDIIEILDLRSFLSKIKKIWDEVILIKGNHDLFLENIATPLKIDVFKRIDLKNYVITHGDVFYKDFLEKKKTFIIGNEHPALKIPELGVEEPVFLVGKRLIVTPAFNPFLKGTNVLDKNFLSSYFNYLKNEKLDVVISKIIDKEVFTEKVYSIYF